MGYYCTVPQCTSLAGKTKNVKFHRFPRDVTMADKWNLILKRGKPYTKYSKVCSLHFTQSDYNVTTMGQWKTLSKDAVPSQNLPKLHADGTVMVIRKSRTANKYRESKREEGIEKDKWVMGTPTHTIPLCNSQDTQVANSDLQDANLNFRLQTLSAIASSIPPHHPPHAAPAPLPLPHQNMSVHSHRPKKQDAIMQTDPVQSEEDDTQPSGGSEGVAEPPGYPYPKTTESFEKKYDQPKDYTKTEEDFIPRTNEEYNSEAEKYALERKSHNPYEKQVDSYPKSVPIDSYQKMDLYPNFSDKAYSNRPDSWYPSAGGYGDAHALLDAHVKREDDALERTKDHLDAGLYAAERRLQQQRLAEQLAHQVKQEPDPSEGTENVMQPQGSPYYTNGHNPAGGYYEARPGAELLIAKQNALAAHTQLWQNTMKRPFFYSHDSPHYTSPPLLHRYEDISRILQ